MSRLLRRYAEQLVAVSGNLRQAASLRASEKGRTVTCEKGCAHCCHQKILVSAADGLAIYVLLRDTGRWTPEMVERLVKADREMTERDHETWFDEKRPCPFLDAETGEKAGRGLCTVYGARPIACASTFSWGGDPNYCAVSDGDGKEDERGQSQIVSVSKAMIEYLTTHECLRAWVEDTVDVDAGADAGADVMFSGIMMENVMLMTLPGAVLWAAASVRNEARPDVHRVLLDGDGTGSVNTFDKRAVFHSEK